MSYRYGDEVIITPNGTEPRQGTVVDTFDPGNEFVVEVYVGNLVTYERLIDQEDWDEAHQETWLLHADEVRLTKQP